MITLSSNVLSMINSPIRQLKARVELFEGSTLLNTFQYDDYLKEFTVERVGEESKFFGFGVCQKLNVKLIDSNREINVSTVNTLKISFGVDADYTYTAPLFYVTEAHRDENTNALSITAYDAIYKAVEHTVSELTIEAPYTIEEFLSACATLLGLSYEIQNVNDAVFATSYPEGANFGGSETIRQALNAIAEATQTIYFLDSNAKLIFKRLDKDGAAVLTIDKEKYISLDSKTNRRLATVCHATELGDNVSASTVAAGSTQYVRNNPFWDMRKDIATIVENALAAVGGTTINQFDCKWRGNFALEIGDKIALTTKDDKTVVSYVLDDVISYNGSLSENTGWQYADSAETASNPSTLGEVLNQTSAKVDKVNKEIELVVSEVEGFDESISKLEMDTNSIQATVESTSTTLDTEISKLNTKVDAVITPEQVEIAIQKEMAKGVDSITTATGFTFNEEGLTVSKSGSEISTQITEDGMTVTKSGEDVLIADNMGVQAIDLHAKTYLIVGTYSRFEDYGIGRTGCFWIK